MIFERHTDDSAILNAIDGKTHLKKRLPKLHKWLTSTFGPDYDSFIAVKVDVDDDDTTILFWTAQHVFHLTANAMPPMRGRRLTPQNKRGYLGLARTARMPDVGELHCRGGDMYDGDYSEKSWNEVVRDLLRHALMQVHEPNPQFRRRPGRKIRTFPKRMKKAK